jgi:8-oxo-dGTP diphosphatase
MSMPEVRHVVGAILLNDQGEVLLQQRDHKPGLRYPGYWTLFGGAVEDGETPDDAIVRELWEELELQLPLMFWKHYDCPARTVPGILTTVNHLYVGQMKRPLETLTLHEGQAMAYFSEVQSAQLTLAFEQSPVLAAFWRERQANENR